MNNLTKIVLGASIIGAALASGGCGEFVDVDPRDRYYSIDRDGNYTSQPAYNPKFSDDFMRFGRSNNEQGKKKYNK